MEKKKLEDMSSKELAQELKKCWAHFRACLAALNGEGGAKPVTLLSSPELGDSDDLELFYTCKQKGGAA